MWTPPFTKRSNGLRRYYLVWLFWHLLVLFRLDPSYKLILRMLEKFLKLVSECYRPFGLNLNSLSLFSSLLCFGYLGLLSLVLGLTQKLNLGFFICVERIAQNHFLKSIPFAINVFLYIFWGGSLEYFTIQRIFFISLPGRWAAFTVAKKMIILCTVTQYRTEHTMFSPAAQQLCLDYGIKYKTLYIKGCTEH